MTIPIEGRPTVGSSRTQQHHARSGILLLFNLSDMASIESLTMARVNFLAVQINQVFCGRLRSHQRALEFPDRLHKGDGPDKRRAVQERQFENCGHHARYTGVCTYERGASVFGIGYGWRS